MRLAMRLSEADPAKAKSEFEAAVLRVVVSRPLTALLLFRSTMAGATGQVR